MVSSRVDVGKHRDRRIEEDKRKKKKEREEESQSQKLFRSSQVFRSKHIPFRRCVSIEFDDEMTVNNRVYTLQRSGERKLPTGAGRERERERKKNKVFYQDKWKQHAKKPGAKPTKPRKEKQVGSSSLI